MDAAAIAAKVAYGYGKAASKLGQAHSVYRPTGPLLPALSPLNLVSAAVPFIASATADGAFKAPSKYGTPIKYGLVNAAVLQVGDYLQGPTGTFFVASINPLEIPMVVECNSVISVSRPGRGGPVLGPGVHIYDARTDATDLALITQWPASVLQGGRTEAPRTDLPSDVSLKGYTVLLPACGVTIETGDRITTDLGTAMAVSAAELTGLGWRLSTSFIKSGGL